MLDPAEIVVDNDQRSAQRRQLAGIARLDTLKPPASLVLNTINNGCLQNPPPGSQQSCLGQGTMPAKIVQGKDAKDVANFVAKVAGKE